MTQFTLTQTRAIELLGDGHSQSTVARALGITESRISQLMSEEQFASAVADRRFSKLQQYNDIDQKYDKLEADALNKLEKALPLMTIANPERLLKAIQILNSAKRRGHEVSPEQTVNHHTVVNLTLPTQVLTKFITSPQTNEVVEIDGEPLITVTPDRIASSHESRKRESLTGPEERPISIPTIRAGQTVSADDLE